VSVILESDF